MITKRFLTILFMFTGLLNATVSERVVDAPVQSVASPAPAALSWSDRLEQATRPDTSLWVLLIVAFLSGVLVSVTPCIYPMIPVTMSILQVGAVTSLVRSFFTAATYVAGISFVYASLGYIAATSSVIFGQWVANPWVVLVTALFFIYFAFSMFGFYELYTPPFLQRQHDLSSHRTLGHVFLFGMVAGTVASPCLTPGLAALLTVAVKVGNPFVGFLLLFVFSLGMGLILLLVGTFAGALSLLPRSGEWLNETKRVMGFLLLAMAVYFAQHVLHAYWAWSLYGLIGLSAFLYTVWRIFFSLRS